MSKYRDVGPRGGLSNSRLYNIWLHMKGRCYRKQMTIISFMEQEESLFVMNGKTILNRFMTGVCQTVIQMN